MKEKYEKEKFRYTSNTDELTRCYNRRAYEEDINKLNLSKEWVYVSMDLNGLKRANDSFGHVAGDELIRAAADCMKSSFSEHGKVYRVGGDEFVVIITKDIPQFENMLRTFEQRVASWHGEFVESMAVSYGYVFSRSESGTAYLIFQKLRMKECMRVRSNITLEAEWTEEDDKNQRNSFDFFFLLILSLYAALDLEVDEGFAYEEYHLLKLWEGRKWK